MTVLGIELGTAWLRVAALVDGQPRVVAQLPAALGFVDGARRTDAALRGCRPDQRSTRSPTGWPGPRPTASR